MDNKMDPQVKDEWVAALRSGEYQQGKNSLRDRYDQRGFNYCCLGVLCDLYARKGEGEWDDSTFIFGEYEPDFAHEGSGILPENLAKHVGLDDGNPTISVDLHGRPMQQSLAELNDGLFDRPGLSFNEIADIIEGNL